MLLRLYVWALNRDLGTQLSLRREHGIYYVEGKIRFAVTVTDLSSTDQRVMAKCLHKLDQYGIALMRHSAPILQALKILLDSGVSLEHALQVLEGVVDAMGQEQR